MQLFSIQRITQYILSAIVGLMVLGFSFVVTQAAPGGVISEIEYSGVLKDELGELYPEGSYALKLVIFDEEFGGTEMYSEVRDGSSAECEQVDVVDGQFDVLLGSCNSIDRATFNNTTLYIETQLDIDGDATFEEIFGSRKRIGSTFASISSAQLVSNEEGNENTLAIDETGNLIFENISGGGNLGIGTTSPLRRISLGNSGSGIDDLGAGVLAFFTNNTERLRITSTGLVGIGTDTPVVALDINATDAIRLPRGTTAQRPAGATGMLRFNTTETALEVYDGTEWKILGYVGAIGGAAGIGGNQTYDVTISSQLYRVHEFTATGSQNFVVSRPGPIDYFIVGGGGGGGGVIGGGGGAGGVRQGTATPSGTGSYVVNVGAGGLGGLNWSSAAQRGASGLNSNIFSISGNGGGGGGAYGGPDTQVNGVGAPAGSGGGGGGPGVGGTGTVGQGNSGGNSAGDNGGAGGGAGGSGGNGVLNVRGGNGGVGITTDISGTLRAFAGGGGGGSRSGFGVGGTGGGGGGGAGGTTDLTKTAQDGNPNSGGGGGAGGYNGGTAGNFRSGGNGGSGIVIIRYPL